MQKGIALYTAFIIVVIAFLTIVTLIVLGKFFKKGDEKVTKIACELKVQTYCEKLLKGENVDWNEIPPESGCGKYEIEEPTKEQCEKLYGV